jgi:abortive infection bacteriophage resistance protein
LSYSRRVEKPFLTLAEQRRLLCERGLDMLDGETAEQLLYDLNYYRISGYARQFQRAPSSGDENFEPGARLERVVILLRLDSDLRALLFEALSRIEVTVRSRFAHEAGRVHGSSAFYLERDQYLSITPGLDEHLAKARAELLRPRLATVARYRDGTDLSRVPIWVAVEHLSFGMLARMVQYFEDSTPARATAHSLSVPWTGFQSTAHALAVLRNVCAHHGQLWNRRVDIVAPVHKKDRRGERSFDNGSVYSSIIAVKRWMRAIDRQSAWSERLDALLDQDAEFEEGIVRPKPR